jgi:hypothetical protein
MKPPFNIPAILIEATGKERWTDVGSSHTKDGEVHYFEDDEGRRASVVVDVQRMTIDVRTEVIIQSHDIEGGA